MLNKFLSQFFLVLVAVSLQIAIFIYGWGLHPLSWKWIIGGGFFATVAIRMLTDMVLKEK